MIPKIYVDVKNKLKTELKGQFVSLTTDGWTSRATDSYINITSCHIDAKLEMKNYVLQPQAMPDSHTDSNIAAVLKEAVTEWELFPPNPPIVSDNAANMSVAAKEFGTTLRVGCFAHTLNLACGRALKLNTVSKLLARMRRIVAYFHRSTTAAAVLKQKQELLQLPSYKLVIDVQTRWNSALDMT
ncbi:zinc finger BED domain-containing protein 1-like [Mizuhopecten yessoensis]|uniref:zinc finger BED domain-containing protein 1-like n=1 Tax=Mizuhopecten yessoensis TaxID=6573 RepID=UPI000B45A54F|nr:zinc finger BED domain-containing protein 1-like [Mizuhopecten yessoensis]